LTRIKIVKQLHKRINVIFVKENYHIANYYSEIKIV